MQRKTDIYAKMQRDTDIDTQIQTERGTQIY